MKNAATPKQSPIKGSVNLSKQYSYNDLVEFLDSHWTRHVGDQLQCVKQLDQALHNPSQATNTILVSGTNGKSLTVHFLTKLFKEEGFMVGAYYSPHILNYNERIVVNQETISNKLFTDFGNEILNQAAIMGLNPNSADVLLLIAVLYFKQQKVDLAVLEVNEAEHVDPTAICTPKIAAITRVTQPETASWSTSLEHATQVILSSIKAGTYVVSADQSKLNLQFMQTVIEKQGAHWSMPIRKLAALAYPFEQLHGRCAALAERVAQIYINNFTTLDNAMVTAASLLTKQKGKRGRPTLDAKRQSELNPRKTIDQFWKDTVTTLPGRFQLLEKEKPTILLDNGSNIDAIHNLLLGIRLLHYQRPLKGLTLILGCDNAHIDMTELLKLLRYFFKKTSGQVMVCPVESHPSMKNTISWNVEAVTNDIKSMKIKARACKSFQEAFEAAEKTVDERHGLLVIAGCSSLISEYWRFKGMKKI